ncbi:GH92 family glycosyl hydrolase [Flavobacterium nackdongense]|uniref:Glycoside hydrolase family 92 protein n=1 Tax=Flavobacterium nackdongense TaxID=2547394 RepID=A0A4P6Y6C8_9FLAO|nr:GH92 family glycosyl hydrolase [Flavobacterium nackdongense]QBN17896.1 glycoside hydrolase family 92 protein [Flavobacterium nackdongense]
MNTFKKNIIPFIVTLFSVGFANAQEDFTKYVDPTIGNVAQFLVPTYPTFSLPNQMLRMFPVKADYLEDQVTAWPLQVEMHRKSNVLKMKVSLGEIKSETWKRKMTIDHDLEIIRPWHYSTYLIDDDITLSFTPAKKCAIYQYDFPVAAQKNILIEGTEAMIAEFLGGNTFAMTEQFTYNSKGATPTNPKMNAYCYGEITDVSGNPLPKVQIVAAKNRLSISLLENEAKTVLLKYAISYISLEQAKKNFKAELAQSNFEKTLANGKKAWEKVINQIEVVGGTEGQKRSFYTALYRTYERMIDINEDGQYYSGYDSKVHQSDRSFYVDDWIWDTFRAKHPLNSILNPKMQSDILNSYVQMYQQSGWMPTFPEVIGNNIDMNCYHSSVLFVDAHRKGISGFDIQKAFEGVKKNLTEATLIPWRQGNRKVGIDDFYHEKGYFPSLKIDEKETEPLVDEFEKRQPVAVTLGMSFDAWALSELAKELKLETDYKKFAQISKNYQNLWHPEKRLFMPKDAAGEWVNINPKLDGGKGYRNYFDENNGWTYAWNVQHDIEGLTNLLGGKEKAEARLDQLFREPLDTRKSLFYVDGSNSTGMVGQFSMGNEPSFHIPYLYNYFGVPWKTQKRVRFLLDVWFKDTIFGIPGDEDGGGMSAFVVFSSLGFYPITPGLPIYTIGSPVFEKSTIHLPNKKDFTVVAKDANKENKYIQKAFFNGKEINTPFFTHNELINGGTLELIMGKKPNKVWGKEAVAPTK